VAAVTLGTVVWAVLLVVAIALHTTLRSHGHLWWIAVAAVGFGLGLMGIAYCRRRAGRIRSRAAGDGQPATGRAG
jgi:hypothetical protein